MSQTENMNEDPVAQVSVKPGAAFRAAPFWAWNGKLKASELKKQIDVFEKMGFGGFHMHPRFGLATPYLSKNFLSMVRFCSEYAGKKGMFARLYDEDRWPSGFAGGAVTVRPVNRAKNIRMTDRISPEAVVPKNEADRLQACEKGQEYLLARYAVKLDGQGRLLAYRLLAGDESASCIRFVYVSSEPTSDWYNGKAYVDVMNERAIAEFIDLTHERYFQELGNEFSRTIPSIFSDEPMFSNFAENGIAWTESIPTAYCERYGEDLLGRLPELFLELSDGRRSEFRMRFYNLCAELFRNAYARQIGDWCERHHLAFTGHYMEEDSIDGQIRRSGSQMRHYIHYTVPGIDMLCDFREYHTAKQAQSVVRQTGKTGMMCECYGSTRYDFDFRRIKLQGDWLAASGVTLRVPHLSWYTMEGLGKRDYPPNFGYQAPWHERFSLLEDHFARVTSVMTRGRPVVRVAVVHPVESGWLMSKQERDALNEKFLALNHLLLGNQIDFDYLDEQLLTELCTQPGFPFTVGEASYDAIVISDCMTLRRTTLDCLSAFRKAGGMLIFLDRVPELMDGIPSHMPAELAKCCECIRTEELISSLECCRDVAIDTDQLKKGVDYLYQLRHEAGCEWLFVAHGDVPGQERQALTIRRRGHFDVESIDTLTGKSSKRESRFVNGYTCIEATLYQHDSLLLKLLPRGSGNEI